MAVDVVKMVRRRQNGLQLIDLETHDRVRIYVCKGRYHGTSGRMFYYSKNSAQFVLGKTIVHSKIIVCYIYLYILKYLLYLYVHALFYTHVYICNIYLVTEFECNR